MTESKTAKVKLDWSRLLGFDQANPSATENNTVEPRVSRAVTLGTRTGSKPGAKFGKKVGVKPGTKVGVKFAI